MEAMYQETIDTDLQKGFIIEVDDPPVNATGKWYLPHHPVTNVNKPGKVCRVLNFETIDEKDLIQRKLLKIVSSIFDTFGISMPLTIRLRKSFQLAWTTGPQWDKSLNQVPLKNLNE